MNKPLLLAMLAGASIPDAPIQIALNTGYFAENANQPGYDFLGGGALYDPVNDETWLFWEGLERGLSASRKRICFVRVYSNVTGLWGPTHVVGTDTESITAHGQPRPYMDPDGYVWCIYGGHSQFNDNEQKSARTSSARDPSSFVADRGFGEALTYPQTFGFGLNGVAVLGRMNLDTIGAWTGQRSGGGAVSWDIDPLFLMELDDDKRFYPTTVVTVGAEWYIAFQITDRVATYTGAEAIGVIKYNHLSGTISDLAGGNVQTTLPVTGNANIFPYRIAFANFSAGSYVYLRPSLRLDAAGNLRMHWIEGAPGNQIIRERVYTLGGAIVEDTTVTTGLGTTGNATPQFWEGGNGNARLYVPDGGTIRQFSERPGGSWRDDGGITPFRRLYEPNQAMVITGGAADAHLVIGTSVFVADGQNGFQSNEDINAAGNSFSWLYGEDGVKALPAADYSDDFWAANVIFQRDFSRGGTGGFVEESPARRPVTLNHGATIAGGRLVCSSDGACATTLAHPLDVQVRSDRNISLELIGVRFDLVSRGMIMGGINSGTPPAKRGFQLVVDPPNNNMRWDLRDASNNITNIDMASPVTFVAGTRYDLTWEVFDGRLYCFVDGVLCSGDVAVPLTTPFHENMSDEADNLRLGFGHVINEDGSVGGGASFSFRGSIEAIRVTVGPPGRFDGLAHALTALPLPEVRID